MRADKQFVLICYDISADGPRARVAERLEEIAIRVQFSVFEARLTDAQLKSLHQELSVHLTVGDSLRMYPLPSTSVQRCLIAGRGPEPASGPYRLF